MYTNYCPCWWDTTTCEGCGRQVETTMHMLCFCSRGTEVWRACKLALPCIVKESWSFVDTFSRLRTSWEAQPELLERWVTICWGIWKSRNEVRHGGKRRPGPVIVRSSLKLLEDFQSANERPSRPRTENQSSTTWKPPPPGSFKVNVDGASGIPSRQLTTSCPEVDGVYGRDVDKEEIFKLLQSNESSDHDICVVPIVGMGGVGKTTLAQLVYNDKRVKDSFDYTTWNCVSENFDVLRILKTIFEQVTATTCDIHDLNLLQVKIRERFGGKKIFVVLDDVWNEKYNVWDDLLRIFRCGTQEIKIIVTTHSENVALVVSTVTIHYLKQLSDEECWLLFAEHAFKNGNSHKYLDLEVIGKGIVHKCKDLPLAAKTLGGLLRSKEDPREWEKILKSDMWDLPEGKSDILPALRLSYHYLLSHLKRCFAYCLILPKDYEFRKEDLVLLWMAEDLLQQCKGNARMEERGEW